MPSADTSPPIKVLIVEDNDLVAQTLARCCEPPDFEVVALTNSTDSAVRAAEAYRPHVALVDYRLGADNGIATARRLLAIDPTLTVIISTADPDPVVEEARQAGCWGCIEKSVSMGRSLPDLLRRVVNTKGRLPS